MGELFFHPTKDVLFGINSSTDQLIAFNTNSWNELARFSIGENVGASQAFDDGVMTISDEGRHIFVSTPAGARMIIPGLTAPIDSYPVELKAE